MDPVGSVARNFESEPPTKWGAHVWIQWVLSPGILRASPPLSGGLMVQVFRYTRCAQHSCPGRVQPRACYTPRIIFLCFLLQRRIPGGNATLHGASPQDRRSEPTRELPRLCFGGTFGVGDGPEFRVLGCAFPIFQAKQKVPSARRRSRNPGGRGLAAKSAVRLCPEF